MDPDLVKLDINSLDDNSNVSVNVEEFPKEKSVNFGPGIELLMNEKKKI